jgi:inorganic pyrophosphatase
MKVLRPIFALCFGIALAATGCIFADDDEDDDEVDSCVITCEDAHEECTIDCDDDQCIATCDDELEVCKTDCE